jgi:hypothetical protein
MAWAAKEAVGPGDGPSAQYAAFAIALREWVPDDLIKALYGGWDQVIPLEEVAPWAGHA